MSKTIESEASVADKSTKAKKIRVKKTELTVRQRSEQDASKAPKRTLRKTAKSASRPFKAVGRFIAKIARPFRFLLRPFKTRPVRFVGRILHKVLFISYFKGAWKEVRQVSWPGRRETWQLTFAVFVFAFVFGAMITIVDYGLDKIFKKLILE